MRTLLRLLLLGLGLSGVACSPVCGDGIVDAPQGETCDDANSADSDDCPSTCEIAVCGDGFLLTGVEACDNGAENSEVEPDACRLDCSLARCGDGVTDQGEACDDGNSTNGDGCNNDCSLAPVAAISVGVQHACALGSEGQVRCWGAGDGGRLGYGNQLTLGDDETPAQFDRDVDVGGVVVQLATATFHTCALLDTGAVRCWGLNDGGQLGYGINTLNIGDNEVPASVGDVPLGGVAVQIVVGFAHSCALLETGAVRCWGFGDFGQLGYGNPDPIGIDNTPEEVGDVPLGGAAVQITAGQFHTCALLDTGAVRCWGRGQFGRLGYGNSDDIGDNETPAQAGDINVGGQVVQIAAGEGHTCALLLGGDLRCWGFASDGQLGQGNGVFLGDDEDPAGVSPIDAGGEVLQVATGSAHTCALLADGALRCWGRAAFGQLGQANTESIGDDELPREVPPIDVGGGVVTQFSTAGDQTCVRVETGALRCWGSNQFGQLGYGNTDNLGDDEFPVVAGEVSVF